MSSDQSEERPEDLLKRVLATAGEILLSLSTEDLKQIQFYGMALSMDALANEAINQGATTSMRQMNAMCLLVSAVDFLTGPDRDAPGPRDIERREERAAIKAMEKRLQNIAPTKATRRRKPAK